MTKFAVAKLQSCSKSFLHWCESDRTEFCGYLADTRSFASPAIMVIGPIVMSTSLFLFRANHTFKSPLLSSLHCFQLNRHNSQAHTYNYGAMYVHCVTIRHPIWVKALLEATRRNKPPATKATSSQSFVCSSQLPTLPTLPCPSTWFFAVDVDNGVFAVKTPELNRAFKYRLMHAGEDPAHRHVIDKINHLKLRVA